MLRYDLYIFVLGNLKKNNEIFALSNFNKGTMTKINFVFESINVFEYFSKELVSTYKKIKNKKVTQKKHKFDACKEKKKLPRKVTKYEALIQMKETKKFLYNKCGNCEKNSKKYECYGNEIMYYGIDILEIAKIDLFEIKELKNYLLKESIKCKNFMKKHVL